ncbi:MAG: 5-formyltetrahydrofolate cyclo-ligase [Eubacteriaceae bacterium]|nr:5-formyltetrahydrofolate cyclo-ligase [Eubacteriaceae bacterium]
MKEKIRNEILKKRNNMDREERKSAGIAIMEKVLALPAFKNAGTVFIYAAVNSEVDTCGIIEAALKAGKTVGLPRVAGKEMKFFGISRWEDLEPGSFSIPEPKAGCPLIEKCDLMIMPGVAFDEDRHRIGYGGGFYDRYLAGSHLSSVDKIHDADPERSGEIRTAAIAFDLQICSGITAEGTDISPDMIITEKRMF